MNHQVRIRLIAAAAGLAIAVLVQGSAGASTSLTISGSSSTATQKPRLTSCASGANECGTVLLAGLGAADWDYVYGPTFTPDGKCYAEDGTVTITLRSDHSAVSGALTGEFCPKASSNNNGADNSYGNPYVEDDTIAFADGSGQFAGLAGNVHFHSESAGARGRVSFEGTLND